MMRTLSIWAKHNPFKSRLIIISIHFILILWGILDGVLLEEDGILLPGVLVPSALILAVICFILYPEHRSKPLSGRFSNIYSLQKICDFVLAFTGFLIFSFIGNQPNRNIAGYPVATGYMNTSPMDPIGPSGGYGKNDGGKIISPANKTHSRKEFRKQLRTFLKSGFKKKEKKSGRTLPVIVIVLAALGLSLVVAGLACSAGCGGSTTGAVLISVIGIGAIIFGAVKLIQGVNKKHPKEEPATTH